MEVKEISIRFLHNNDAIHFVILTNYGNLSTLYFVSYNNFDRDEDHPIVKHIRNKYDL